MSSLVNGVSNNWQYSYLQNSELISVASNQQFAIVSARTYEGNRNLMTKVKNMAGTNVISQFDYTSDALGRRTQRIDSGSLVGTNAFGYNIKSELTSAVMNTNTYGYGYDSIGNLMQRITLSNDRGETNTYIANALNQYLAISNQLSVINPLYDLDGNLTQSVTLSDDGVTTNAFTWDAENRLSKVYSNGTLIVSNAYDYMSRRISKASGTTTNIYVYDGWNLLEEQTLSDDGVLTNYYAWGLDLSGSLQGAGGVGGMLLVNLNGSNYFPLADANGNITEYIDGNSNIVAHYEYSPFGGITASSGALKDEFKFRFSSKYFDGESGLGYWGYRFYSPELGRWLSRDPIEEDGGLLLYGYCENDWVNGIDGLGMWNWRISEDVWKIQTVLNIMGYDVGVTGAGKNGIDGKYGPKTREAVCKFQNSPSAWGILNPDGLWGKKTDDLYKQLEDEGDTYRYSHIRVGVFGGGEISLGLIKGLQGGAVAGLHFNKKSKDKISDGVVGGIVSGAFTTGNQAFIGDRIVVVIAWNIFDTEDWEGLGDNGVQDFSVQLGPVGKNLTSTLKTGTKLTARTAIKMIEEKDTIKGIIDLATSGLGDEIWKGKANSVGIEIPFLPSAGFGGWGFKNYEKFYSVGFAP